MLTHQNPITTTGSPLRLAAVLLSVALLLMGGLTACSSDDPEPAGGGGNTPEVPVDPSDYQDVPVTGATLTKGDLSITFAPETFAKDERVAITELKKGDIGGEDDASPFYRVTLPKSSQKPFTVGIKGDEADDVAIVLISPGYSISLGREDLNENVLETSYDNGEYTTTVSAFDQSDSDEHVSITIGLGRLPDAEAADSRAGTRTVSELVGKDGNVSWTLDITYGMTGKYSLNYRKLSDKLPEVNMCIKECVKAIHDLGFKMPDGVTMHYHMNKQEHYGSYNRSLLSRDYDCIKLKGDMALGDNTSFLKQVIIHETLHNFQSYYLPTFLIYPVGYHNTMYEIGAVWIEKLMNGGYLNGNWQIWDAGLSKTFKNHFRLGLSRSSADANKLYEDYAEQGYALAPLLYYLISRNYSRGYDDKVVMPLYDTFWGKIYTDDYTILDVLNEWYTATFKEHFFDGAENINNYYLALWKGGVMPDFRFDGLQQGIESYKLTINKLSEKNSNISLDGNVYPFGCEGLMFMLDTDCFKDSLLTDDELVIRQEGDGLKTYLLYTSGNNIIQHPQVAVKGTDIVIPGTEIEKLRGRRGFYSTFFLLTVRQKCALTDVGALPSHESAFLRKAQSSKVNISAFSLGGTLMANETKVRVDGKTERRETGYYPWASLIPDDNTKIEAKLAGTTLHVEATQKASEESGGWNVDTNYIISFDVENFVPNYKQSKLVNLNVRAESDGKYGSADLDIVQKSDWQLAASAVPLSQVIYNTKSTSYFTFKASVKDGLKVDSYVYNSNSDYTAKNGAIVSDENTKTVSGTYADKPDNYLDIRIELLP